MVEHLSNFPLKIKIKDLAKTCVVIKYILFFFFFENLHNMPNYCYGQWNRGVLCFHTFLPVKYSSAVRIVWIFEIHVAHLTNVYHYRHEWIACIFQWSKKIKKIMMCVRDLDPCQNKHKHIAFIIIIPDCFYEQR